MLSMKNYQSTFAPMVFVLLSTTFSCDRSEPKPYQECRLKSISKIFSQDPAFNEVVRFHYDPAGNVSIREDNNTSTRYTYDSENRMTTLAYGDIEMRFTYKSNSFLVKLYHLEDGKWINRDDSIRYVLNPNGTIKSYALYGFSTVKEILHEFTYDERKNPVRMVRSFDGIEEDETIVTYTTHKNPAARLPEGSNSLIPFDPLLSSPNAINTWDPPGSSMYLIKYDFVNRGGYPQSATEEWKEGKTVTASTLQYQYEWCK